MLRYCRPIKKKLRGCDVTKKDEENDGCFSLESRNGRQRRGQRWHWRWKLIGRYNPDIECKYESVCALLSSIGKWDESFIFYAIFNFWNWKLKIENIHGNNGFRSSQNWGAENLKKNRLIAPTLLHSPSHLHNFSFWHYWTRINTATITSWYRWWITL